MNGLEFDKMAVDTSLAQEYLEKHKTISLMHEYKFDGKDFTKRETEEIQTTTLDHNKFKLYETQKKFDLASQLKKNANLIAQLEFVIRKIPIEVTNAQLNLIIQHLKCRTQLYMDFDKDVLPIIFNGPLLLFGNILDILSYVKGNLIVRASKETAIVSHLFVKLCHEAGLDSIILEILSDSEILQKEQSNTNQEWHFGTVAIVSEDADVDSAVDTFISSPKQAPWYLRRILVQESIYQQFKDALSWKCNLKKQENEVKISSILCSETLTYNGREFLIDPVELSTDASVVSIEAYRTRKEVISLVQQDKPHFLSLWANGIAEINEVTHSTSSPVVWVNTLADFRGPRQVAEAVYSNAMQLDVFKIRKCEKISKLCELSKSWLKLDFESRLDILKDTLDKIIAPYPSNEIALSYLLSFHENLNFRKYLSVCALKSFVDAGSDYGCVGLSKPVGIKVINRKSESFFTEECVKSILYGNALAIGDSLDAPYNAFAIQEESKYYDALQQAGVPVVYVGKLVKGDFSVYKCNADTLQRAIWTNSGTIFAN